MKWIKSEIDRDTVREISGKYSIDLLTASILTRRGLTEPEKVKFYLENDLSLVHNPFLFVEMNEAVERILRAKAEEEKVMIFGDRDVDGITSTVLIKNTLADIGIDAAWKLPEGDEPYGLTIDAVEAFAKEDGTLIITVDCGISNHAEIARAQELGIDTIVTDHHNPSETLPPALALLNPKVEESGYPFRELCGCGVASKLAWAVKYSQTQSYNQTVCLLNVMPGNESFIIEAMTVQNLVEVDRVTETLVPGVVDITRTRLYRLLEGNPILVFQEQAQKKMLAKLFGTGVEFQVLDIAPEIWKTFPAIEGRSLLKLLDQSKMKRYSSVPPTELDIFFGLFTRHILRREKELSDYYRNLLDLVALGTLADLMPLEDENRILVRSGMEVLNTNPRPGIRQLMMQQGIYGKKLSTTDVGWQLTPILNATGRLGVPSKAVDLLLNVTEQNLEQLGQEVISLNKQRKKLGDNLWPRVLKQGKESYQNLESKFVLIEEREMHRGITGIVAARLVNFFKVPAGVLAYLDGKIVGSLRSPDGFNVKDFLDNFSDLLIDYGGHDCAAGFSLDEGNYQAFMTRFPEVVYSLKYVEPEEESIQLDAELPPAYLNPDLVKTVEFFEPYGTGSAPLVFLAKGLKIEEMSVIGKSEQQHLKLLLDSGSFKWPGIFWKAADRAGKEFDRGDKLDVMFRLGRNYYNNRETLQLTVLDARKAT